MKNITDNTIPVMKYHMENVVSVFSAPNNVGRLPKNVIENVALLKS